ncbi:hypothetical protein HAX54_029448, partial [Datura stramonium]|nr:hypothetical protein [Datura stramonium]
WFWVVLFIGGAPSEGIPAVVIMEDLVVLLRSCLVAGEKKERTGRSGDGGSGIWRCFAGVAASGEREVRRLVGEGDFGGVLLLAVVCCRKRWGEGREGGPASVSGDAGRVKEKGVGTAALVFRKRGENDEVGGWVLEGEKRNEK